jgi:hypothetical protein
METLISLVQGSAPEPYTVTFKKDGSNLSAYCTVRPEKMDNTVNIDLRY